MVETLPVVLVHGGFLGPWIWRDVEDLLRAQGVDSVAPDLPSMQGTTGRLAEDVASVQEALGAVGPAVVCGHSYAGMVVTEAAAVPDLGVQRLIYLAAAVPAEGHDMQSLAASLGLADDDDGSEEVTVLPDGRVAMTKEAARTSLFHDCSAGRADAAIAQLRPLNPATGNQTVARAAWRHLPATLVEAAEDRLPRLVSTSFDATDHRTVRLPTGHCPQWSRPDLVAQLLLEAAAGN